MPPAVKTASLSEWYHSIEWWSDDMMEKKENIDGRFTC